MLILINVIFSFTPSVCYHKDINESIIKGINSETFLASQQTVISHLRNTLIIPIEDMVRNHVHCSERHSIYHQTANKKRILTLFKMFVTFQFNDCPLLISLDVP